MCKKKLSISIYSDKVTFAAVKLMIIQIKYISSKGGQPTNYFGYRIVLTLLKIKLIEVFFPSLLVVPIEFTVNL